jgi:hypothetical protein
MVTVYLATETNGYWRKPWALRSPGDKTKSNASTDPGSVLVYQPQSSDQTSVKQSKPSSDIELLEDQESQSKSKTPQSESEEEAMKTSNSSSAEESNSSQTKSSLSSSPQ